MGFQLRVLVQGFRDDRNLVCLLVILRVYYRIFSISCSVNLKAFPGHRSVAFRVECYSAANIACGV